MSSIRLFSLLFCLSILIIITIPIQTLLNIFRFKLKYIYPLFFYKVITNITGLNIHTEGFNEEDKKGTGTLYIANHVSWFDILCLGSVLNARFIAKKEVSSMGIFGFLAKLSNTFFIDSSDKNKIYQYNNFIREKLIHEKIALFTPYLFKSISINTSINTNKAFLGNRENLLDIISKNKVNDNLLLTLNALRAYMKNSKAIDRHLIQHYIDKFLKQ